jgi:hypothetical protein
VWGFVEHLVAQSMHIYTQVELIDLDTVRLLGLFKEDSASGSEALGGAIDLVDLFAALDSPEANDVANFSLDLLPSVLETRRSTGAQTFAVDGYASIERKGNIDSLVLSELAYDREIFEKKVVDAELLYYGRDKQREDERRLQYLLIDCSASMRGQRQVFARGLALALIKKLTLEGDETGSGSSIPGCTRRSRSAGPARSRCRTCCRSAASAAATTARCSASSWSRSPGCAASRSAGSCCTPSRTAEAMAVAEPGGSDPVQGARGARQGHGGCGWRCATASRQARSPLPPRGGPGRLRARRGSRTPATPRRGVAQGVECSRVGELASSGIEAREAGNTSMRLDNR